MSVCHLPAGISVGQQYYTPHGLKCTENIRRYANGADGACVQSPCWHLCRATVLHTAWTEMYGEYKMLCERNGRCVCVISLLASL